jgi:hypothetical protein
LAVEDTVSPRVLAKIVYAGTFAASFVEAGNHLAKLADIEIRPERVRRACGRVAFDRIEHHQRLQAAYHGKPLLERSCGKPADKQPPEIACVMADGGRYQHLDRSLPASGKRSARKGEHWKESRIGLLASMSGPRHDVDPQPELPPELRYQAIAETLSEIGKTGSKCESPEGGEASADVASAPPSEGLVGPAMERRSVVASRQNWEAFGSLLASQAWYHGFAAAAEKQYDAWAEKLWQGRVEDVIDELIAYGAKLGAPPPDARSDDPREVIRVSRVFYENHAGRMDYPAYRRQGFPLTSSLMESTVKQVSRRVKGTEKYWSSAGGEAILRLRGEYLSDDEPMANYWADRPRRASGTRAYRQKLDPVYD